MRGLRRWLVWACLLWAAAPALALALPLTPQEQQWIASHPEVRSVVLAANEPYYRAPPAGPPSGFAIDLMALVAQRTGLSFRYVWAASIVDAGQILQRGEAEMTPLVQMTPQRARLLSMPGVMIPLEQVFVTRRDGTDLSELRQFEGRRLGLVAGSVDDETVQRDYPGAVVTRFATALDAFTAVSDGRVDLMPSTLHAAVYTIETNLLSNLRVRRLQAGDRSSFGPGVLLSQPLLHSILAKGLDSITPAERAAIAQRWLPQGERTLFADASIVLSAAEQQWVAQKGEVRVGYDAQFAPFTQQGAFGAFEGLAADVLRAAAAKAGLRLVKYQGASFDEVLGQARKGQIDIVAGMARNASRSLEFEFIGPFSRAATVTLMRSEDTRLFTEPDDMPEGRVALLRNHFLIERLKSHNPQLVFVELDTQQAVVQALADGQADMAIGNAFVVNRLVDAGFRGRVQATGVVRDGDSELFFGVPKSHPELARVLEKGLLALSPAEQSQLRQRWLFVRIQPGLQWVEVLRWVLPVALPVLLLLAVLWLGNRRLRAAHALARREHQAAETAIAARGRFLAYLSHELRGSISAIASGAEMLLRPDAGVPAPAMLGAIKTSADGLGAMLQRTLDYERTLAAGPRLQPAAHELLAWWQATLAPFTLQAGHKGLQLQLQDPPAGLRLRFDATALAQVLNNLLGNAVKFTAQGEVRASAHWLAREGRLHIHVADQGPGIAAADRAALFEPYAQGEAGRRAGQGAGLGLAISREIVRAMGGTLELGDAPGGGCLFTLDLPMELAA